MLRLSAIAKNLSALALFACAGFVGIHIAERHHWSGWEFHFPVYLLGIVYLRISKIPSIEFFLQVAGISGILLPFILIVTPSLERAAPGYFVEILFSLSLLCGLILVAGDAWRSLNKWRDERQRLRRASSAMERVSGGF